MAPLGARKGSVRKPERRPKQKNREAKNLGSEEEGERGQGGQFRETYEVTSEGLKVDQDVRQYFQEIAPLVGRYGSVTDPEELAVLCSNGLEEAQGKEAALACDASCGRTLEALLTSAELPRLLMFLLNLSSKEFVAAARHYSGSHVIETALQALKQHGDMDASEKALSAVCKAASKASVELLCDRYGSHVLRRILSTLSGHDVQPGHSKHMGQTKNEARIKASRPPFPNLLAKFAEGLANAAGPHIKQLRLDSSAGPGLQAILLALESADDSLARLVRTFLGCADTASAPQAGEALASADPEEVRELMRERSGSHLMEVIVRVSPPVLQAEVFDRFFRGQLKELALHPSANFVLQAFLAAARNSEQVVAAVEELEAHFPQLLSQNRGGVIAALLAACGRLGTHQKEVCRSFARAVTSQSSSPARVLPDLLGLERYAAAADRWAKLPPLNCAMLITIFGYPKGSCQQFIESMSSLTEAECVALASDPGGSRVVEAFLTGAALDKQKRSFVSKLRGHFGELAVEACGSHCVEKCFAASDIKLKEVIVGELAGAEAALLRTPNGAHILRKTSVPLFKSSPVSWRAHVSASEGARQMFADLFSDRPVKQSRKSRRDNKTSLKEDEGAQKETDGGDLNESLDEEKGMPSEKEEEEEDAEIGSKRGEKKKSKRDALGLEEDGRIVKTAERREVATGEIEVLESRVENGVTGNENGMGKAKKKRKEQEEGTSNSEKSKRLKSVQKLDQNSGVEKSALEFSEKKRRKKQGAQPKKQ